MATSIVRSPLVPVRVAFCITELDPGGAERALAEIVRHLPSENWNVRVYCLGPETDLARQLNQSGVLTICLGARRSTDINVLFKLVQELRAFRPTILQTFLFHANIAGRLAGWWARVPVILSGLRVAEREKWWHLWIDRWTNGLVRFNVCVSEGVRRFAVAEGHLPENKLRVIPNGVDLERFQQSPSASLLEFGIPDGSWTLVTVGRLAPQKGQLDLIEAVAPLLREAPVMHLLIVGEGPSRMDLTEAVKRYGVAANVHLAGWRGDVPEILRSCQAFVLPSRWEGMPNALLEAIAAGRPWIATDVEGVQELLEAGNAGEIVIPGDVNALRMAVKKIYDQHPFEPHKEPQSTTANIDTWNSVSQRYAALFKECLPPPLEKQT